MELKSEKDVIKEGVRKNRTVLSIDKERLRQGGVILWV